MRKPRSANRPSACWAESTAARPALLEKLQATERSAAMKEAIANSLRELPRKVTAPPAVVEPPPSEPISLHPPVTPALRDCLEKLFAAYNVYAAEHNQRLAAATPKQHFLPSHPLSSAGPDDIERTCRLLEEGGAVQDVLSKSLVYLRSVLRSSKDAFRTLLEHPDFQLIHLVRFLAMIQGIRIPHARYSGIDWRATTYIEIYRRSHTPKITLVQLAEAIRGIGLPDEILREHVLGSFVPVFRWEPESVWPFFSNKVNVLERAFEPAAGDFLSSWHRQFEFDNALRLLAMFPQVPPALAGKLWELAIGTSKADRLRAQKAVIRLPDLPERLTQALAARSFQTRAVAAEWMGRLGDRRYVAPLHAAAKAEKQDAALDEILTALERLGEAIEPYLDRDKLQAEAQKGLKKGNPAGAGMVPLGAPAQSPMARQRRRGTGGNRDLARRAELQAQVARGRRALAPLLRHDASAGTGRTGPFCTPSVARPGSQTEVHGYGGPGPRQATGSTEPADPTTGKAMVCPAREDATHIVLPDTRPD